MPRGGKRPGAGRKPGRGGRSLGRKKTLKLAFEKGIIGAPRDSLRTEVSPPAPGVPAEPDRSAFILPPGSAAARAVKAADILATVDELKLWQSHLLSSDPKVAFWALQYLMDQRDGRAKQSSDVKVISAIENRSDEELAFLVAHGQWPEEAVNADNEHRESREAAAAS
jgi:hypothetical protein